MSEILPPSNPTVAVLHHAQKHKVSRAPMLNPYDKFTQPEFDSWIGDMTSALRRALGYEQEVPRLLEKVHVNVADHGGSPKYRQLDLSDQDEEPDDSFAQVQTRRNKGKARDPREGPGLGRDRTQPIEVVSSDEEEVEDVAFSLRDDDPHLDDDDEHVGSDSFWERSSPSNVLFSPVRIGVPARFRQKSWVEQSSGGSEEDEEDDDDCFIRRANDTSEVITITSDEESIDGDENGEEGEEEEEDRRERDNHDCPGPSSIRYSRRGSSDEEGDDEIDVLQPLDDDTSFPPHPGSMSRNLELNDPWDAPRRFSMDYFSGGEVQAGTQLHPDHLGSFDEIESIEEDEERSQFYESAWDRGALSNSQSASEIYQDYYSKGDVNTTSLDQFNPHPFVLCENKDGDAASGVFTPDWSTHLEYAEDVGGSAHEGIRTLSALPSIRNQPIPQDVEIIAVDDSDDDEEEVIPPFDAIVEIITDPVTKEPEEEEFGIASSTPAFPVVESIDKDEALVVYPTYPEDIDNCLQSSEIVELDAAGSQEPLETKVDVRHVPLEIAELGIEEQDVPGGMETIELKAIHPNTLENALPLDAASKSSTIEANEQAPKQDEDLDDIYETSVPLRPQAIEPSESLICGARVLDNEDAHVKMETPSDTTTHVEERPSEKNWDGSPTGNAGTEVNDDGETSILVNQSLQQRESNGIISKNIVPEPVVEESQTEAQKHHVDVTSSWVSAPANGFQDIVSILDHHNPEEPEPKTPESPPKDISVVSSPSRICVPGQPQIPMPVMADESVPDPTESPSQERHIFDIPATPNIIITSHQTPEVLKEPLPELPPLPSVNSNADGLFTPAEFSTATTPVEDSVVLVLPPQWQERDVWGPRPRTIADLDAPTELAEKSVALSSPERVDILTQTDIDTLPSLMSPTEELAVFMQRKSVLIPDPYPYCLSTPIASMVADDSEDDDNSVSSNDTGRENEEFVYPLIPDIAPHILPAMTESESTCAPPSGATNSFQVTKESTQSLLDSTIVAERQTLPTLEKDDTLVATELKSPSPPTMDFEDSSPISSEARVEDYKEQVSQQPLEVADFRPLVEKNGMNVSNEMHKELEAFHSVIPNDAHNEQVKEGQAESISPASRPSKRKRELSSEPSECDARGKFRAGNKGRQIESETVTTELAESVGPSSPLDHRDRDSAFPESPESSSQNQTIVGSDESYMADKTGQVKTKVPSLDQPQLLAPALFHAHGRNKRRKAYVQPIGSLKQTRDPEDRPPTHPTVPEKASLQCEPLRDLALLLPGPTPAVSGVSETQEIARSSTETLQPKVTAVVLPVPVPQPSSIGNPAEIQQTVPSVPATIEAIPSTPFQSSPARLLPPLHSTSSLRSTRSQCKYHKITLPKEENGPRVCFLVPGCSLTDQVLMKDEEIEDHGEATYEDSLRIIQDIEDLDFDQYLIGTLRQLVGLDILREGEVYYLPQAGDGVMRKHWPRKSTSERISMAKGSDSASFSASPRYSYSGSVRSPSTRPPLSNADSISATVSCKATTDDEDDNQAGSDQMSLSKGKRKTKVRKGKIKGMLFQSDEGPEESPDEESIPKNRRKSTKRGVKRTRTHDGTMGIEGTRKSKRLRLHLTDTSLHQDQEHD